MKKRVGRELVVKEEEEGEEEEVKVQYTAHILYEMCPMIL